MIKKVIAAALITAVAGTQADATVFNGFAVGVNGGVLIAQNKTSLNIAGTKIKNANKTMGLFGIQFDYEMSKANSFYGRIGLLVSAPTGKATSTTKTYFRTIRFTVKNNVMTELHGAFGYNFCNDVVVYGLAGLSVSKKTYSGNLKGSGTKVVTVVGAGLMKKVANKISTGIEYKYTIGRKDKIRSIAFNTIGKIKSDSHTVLARVSYHF